MAERRLAVEGAYLWVPVCLAGQRVRLHIYAAAGGAKLHETAVRAGEGPPDYYVPLRVDDWGQEALLADADAPAGWLARLRFESHAPPPEPCARPRLHFTPARGWMNDPCGMLYLDGEWHLFFESHPYDVQWCDMHWGHAVSRDLLHWRQVDDALEPDEDGGIYTGSGVIDREGALGYGGGAAVFFYTASGGTASRWAAGKPFRQKIAWMWQPDKRLAKTGLTAIECLVDENRDPKVFWHGESGAYVLALYLGDNVFALFRSQNLRDWRESQRITLEGGAECPDIFPLPDGSGGSRWVFWSVGGNYWIGDFDGWRFTPQSGRLSAYQNKAPWAAQSFYNAPGGRVVMMVCLYMENRGRPYSTVMSLPMELGLAATPAGLRVRQPLAGEVLAAAKPLAQRDGLAAGRVPLASTGGGPVLVRLRLPAGAPAVTLGAAGARLTLDLAGEVMTTAEKTYRLEGLYAEEMDISVLVDEQVTEVRLQNDTLLFAVENTCTLAAGEVFLICAAAMPDGAAAVYTF